MREKGIEATAVKLQLDCVIKTMETLDEVAIELVTVEISKEVVTDYLKSLDDLQKRADELEKQIENLLE